MITQGKITDIFCMMNLAKNDTKVAVGKPFSSNGIHY